MVPLWGCGGVWGEKRIMKGGDRVAQTNHWANYTAGFINGMSLFLMPEGGWKSEKQSNKCILFNIL